MLVARAWEKGVEEELLFMNAVSVLKDEKISGGGRCWSLYNRVRVLGATELCA